jgi:preprotein translocase subunit SecA
MARFVEGEDRRQQTMLPACLEDYIAEDNAVRVVDAFNGKQLRRYWTTLRQVWDPY